MGGGNSAGQAAVYLPSQVAKVWLMVRGRSLEASMSRYLVDRITAKPNVEILTETTSPRSKGRTVFSKRSAVALSDRVKS